MNTLMLFVAYFEAITIIVLAEPVLNRMSPCSPFAIRMAFHAIAVGSVFRLYHLIDGHQPSWSALLQIGGFTAPLLIDQLGRSRKVDRRGKHFEPAPDDYRRPPTETG